MSFGHDTKPTRVYRYGARRPTRRLEEVERQLGLSRRYRNDLVRIEHARRDSVAAVVREHYPRLVELDTLIAEQVALIDETRAQIRRSNSEQRAKRGGTADERATLRQQRDQCREWRAEHKAIRRAAYGSPKASPPPPTEEEGLEPGRRLPGDPALLAALDGVDAHDLVARKRVRADYSEHIAWPTRGQVEQGLAGIRRGAPPRFVGEEWDAKLAVQLQVDTARGIDSPTWGDLVAGASHQSVARVEKQPLPPGATADGRRARRPIWHLHMRIASDGRDPVMAVIPFVLHRAPPADARIKWIYLVRRRRATHYEWSVQFVLARSAWPHADSVTASGTAGVNCGYRMLEDGSLRVAYVVGSDHHHEELVLDARHLARWSHVDGLQSIREREFAGARAALVDWLATHEDEAPEWLSDRTTTLAQWRSQRRLASLVRTWREERFDGDALIYTRMEEWRKQDRHLYDWAAHEAAYIVRWRRERYRRFAARLRQRYEGLVTEDTDWATLGRRPDAEDDTEWLDRRRQARIASPGLLRRYMREAHPDAIVGDAMNITRTCLTCGVVDETLNAARRIIVTCPSCGTSIDQDERAATNLLRQRAVPSERARAGT